MILAIFAVVWLLGVSQAPAPTLLATGGVVLAWNVLAVKRDKLDL